MKIQPKKSLGQNFLINAGILNKIVEAVGLSSSDTVLEIGPGTGNLTKLLSDKAGRVIAIEKDRRLIEGLKEKFANTNVEIVEGDVLKFDPEKHGLKDGKYKIVGNIPYYITSHLLRIIFDPAGSGDTADRQKKGRASSGARRWPRPKLIVLTVQKEVAKRIVAKPPDMNLLALSIQFYSNPKIIGYISRGSFRPMPKVDSAIIKITPYNQPTTDSETFFRVARVGFSGKRKQLVNNLSKNFGMIREDLLKIFEKVGIKSDTRAENLSLDQWTELSKLMEK